MKKIFLTLVALLTAFIIIPVVNAEDKVPVYMFTKNGCSACESAFEYFDNLKKENEDLFDLYIIEVYDGNWNINSEEVFNLLISSLTKVDGDTEKIATPTIFIGDYYTVGLPGDETEVYNEIVAYRDSEDKKSIVEDAAKELKIDLEQFKDVEKEPGKYDALIIFGIFVILIGGFAGLVVMSKK